MLILIKLQHRYICDCTIRVTAILEYCITWVREYMFRVCGHSSLMFELYTVLLRRVILIGVL